MNSRSSVARPAIVFAAAMLLLLLSSHSTGAQKKHPPANPVDLNSATAAELEQVPGIGPSTAKAIINFREKSGPFQRVEDVLAIRGISKQALERMRPCLTVKPPENPPKTKDQIVKN
jgi:comEA protein